MRRGEAVREARRQGAKERQAERDKRGDDAQLKKLIDNGHGGCKEADRLRYQHLEDEGEESERTTE